MKIFVVFLTLFMLLNPVYNVKVKPVNTDPYFKWTLDLYEDIAVWHEIKEYEHGTVKKSDIVIYNLTTDREEVIDRPGVKAAPMIYGDNLVYFEQVDAIHGDVWLYNIKTKQEEMIKESISNLYVDLYEDKLVYADNSRSDRFQIYLYNLTTGEERLIISDNIADCVKPVVYGDRIAYIKGKVTITLDVKEPQIVLYDLSAGKEKKIAQALSPSDLSMHKDIIAWSEKSEDGKYSVMYYNIKTGEKKRLPVDWAVLAEASVYDNTIIFTGAINETTGGLAGYDLSTGTYFPISTANGGMVFPHIYKNRVVWIDWRNSPRPFQLPLIQPNEIWSAEIRR
jgi:hypothetical protein